MGGIADYRPLASGVSTEVKIRTLAGPITDAVTVPKGRAPGFKRLCAAYRKTLLAEKKALAVYESAAAAREAAEVALNGFVMAKVGVIE